MKLWVSSLLALALPSSFALRLRDADDGAPNASSPVSDVVQLDEWPWSNLTWSNQSRTHAAGLHPLCSCSCCVAGQMTTNSSVSGNNPIKCAPPAASTGRRCSDTCKLHQMDSILGSAVGADRLVHYQ